MNKFTNDNKQLRSGVLPADLKYIYILNIHFFTKAIYNHCKKIETNKYNYKTFLD